MRRLLLGCAIIACMASRSAAADTVTLDDMKTEWQNLYGAILYAGSATVHNTGSAPVRAVQVRLELFDKDGKPVAHADGYNLAAERLNENPAALDAVPPIAPGGTDKVRVSIDKTEIPRPFRTATLTVVEIK
jgi:hypothetical protein